MHRWREIASEQLKKAHALTVHGEHKAWDDEQDAQVGQRLLVNDCACTDTLLVVP